MTSETPEKLYPSIMTTTFAAEQLLELVLQLKVSLYLVAYTTTNRQ
jgi:hypothetical protein